MEFLEKLKKEVKAHPLSLVLSEGDDARVIAAARQIKDQGLASKIFLVGNPEKIRQNSAGVSLDGIEIENPMDSSHRDAFAGRLLELRAREYKSKEEAMKGVENRVYFGSLMQEAGIADIHVSGAVETSADVLKAFFYIVKTNKKEGIATSFFLVETPNPNLGENGVLFLSDCAVNIAPNPKQLAKIAYAVGNIAKDIFGLDAKLSLLSYSTKGSGSGELVDKVLETGRELEALNPSFTFEAEMQSDASIVPEVSQRKAPGNKLGGKANVLIFPNLEAGNIGYKLVERFGNAKAYGPVMAGLNKVASDLSRGTDIESIVGSYVVSAYYHLKKESII